jgi:hypothetical protein
MNGHSNVAKDLTLRFLVLNYNCCKFRKLLVLMYFMFHLNCRIEGDENMCLKNIYSTLNKAKYKNPIQSTHLKKRGTIILYLGHIKYIAAPLAVGLIALLSYHTTLSLDNYSKPDATLSEGVMRSALTATFIVMYVVYFSFALDGTFKFSEGLTGPLTGLTQIIVGFYFASTVASELIRKWKGGTG